MNGIMTSIPDNSSIVSPAASVVMLWTMQGKQHAMQNEFDHVASPHIAAIPTVAVDLANASPAAAIASTTHPSTPPTAIRGNGGASHFPFWYRPTASYMVHANRDNFAFSDGHVKWMIQSGDPATSPFTYNSSGIVQNAWFEAGAGCYPPLFDPGYGGGAISGGNSTKGTY